MSWLDDVVRVVLNLVDRDSDQPLQDRLDAAQRVRGELPAEPAHVHLYVDELISAAQFTARGILPPARARLSSAVPLIELSPMLGYLVFRVAAADPKRTAEAHDLIRRLIAPARSATTPPSIPPVTVIARYDIVASAMLADSLPPTGDVADSLWRAQVLFSVGRPDAAAEMLTHLLEHGSGDVREALAASRGLVEKCVLGRPELARRLLDSVTPRLQPHSSLNSATLHSLVMLVDACSDEGRAQALIHRILPDATSEDFYSWGDTASQSESNERLQPSPAPGWRRRAATFARRWQSSGWPSPTAPAVPSRSPWLQTGRPTTRASTSSSSAASRSPRTTTNCNASPRGPRASGWTSRRGATCSAAPNTRSCSTQWPCVGSSRMGRVKR